MALSSSSFSSSGIFSESDGEEEAALPDSSGMVLESVRNEELVVMRPKVRQESLRSPGEPVNGKSGLFPSCRAWLLWGMMGASLCGSLVKKKYYY